PRVRGTRRSRPRGPSPVSRALPTHKGARWDRIGRDHAGVSRREHPMENRDRPRRPAILDEKSVEQLWGDSDPALASEAAHSTANAVIYGPRHLAEDERQAERIGAITGAEGIDEIARLWSRSPAETLPGALWRLYLLRAWL